MLQLGLGHHQCGKKLLSQVKAYSLLVLVPFCICYSRSVAIGSICVDSIRVGINVSITVVLPHFSVLIFALPSFSGRQSDQRFPDFTQEQFLHFPVLLH